MNRERLEQIKMLTSDQEASAGGLMGVIGSVEEGRRKKLRVFWSVHVLHQISSKKPK